MESGTFSTMCGAFKPAEDKKAALAGCRGRARRAGWPNTPTAFADFLRQTGWRRTPLGASCRENHTSPPWTRPAGTLESLSDSPRARRRAGGNDAVNVNLHRDLMVSSRLGERHETIPTGGALAVVVSTGVFGQPVPCTAPWLTPGFDGFDGVTCSLPPGAPVGGCSPIPPTCNCMCTPTTVIPCWANVMLYGGLGPPPAVPALPGFPEINQAAAYACMDGCATNPVTTTVNLRITAPQLVSCDVFAATAGISALGQIMTGPLTAKYARTWRLALPDFAGASDQVGQVWRFLVNADLTANTVLTSCPIPTCVTLGLPIHFVGHIDWSRPGCRGNRLMSLPGNSR